MYLVPGQDAFLSGDLSKMLFDYFEVLFSKIWLNKSLNDSTTTTTDSNNNNW